MKKKILITGAFGNLGLMCVHQALAMGYDVRCFDLKNKNTQKKASQFSAQVETIFGDIRNQSTQQKIIKDVDAIIHNIAILPPASEKNPALAKSVNLDACRMLIDSIEKLDTKPLFIFPSSVTVFGLPTENETPRTINDDINPTDHYTHHKLTIESALKKSNIYWSILRVGVAVDTRTLRTDRETFKRLLNIKPNNPLEYIHPKDVAYAMCRAARTEQARNKILLIGGGESCQITQRDFINTAFESLGIPLPLSIHGQNTFYTHWMDTTESQKLLAFQRHSFEDYKKEMDEKLKPLRLIIRPFRWLVQLIIPKILRLL